MAPWRRITLVAAGASAGIAATFNTPIGGVMFAIELMLPEISARTFLPVALATGTATFIGRIFLGLQPAFAVPAALLNSDKPASLTALLLYALLGALMGLAATAFIKRLSLAEDVFEGVRNGYLRHAIGMLLIGSLMYALLRTSGQYYVDGVGYATIQAILSGGLIVPGLLALLFFAKLCATSVSLGSAGRSPIPPDCSGLGTLEGLVDGAPHAHRGAGPANFLDDGHQRPVRMFEAINGMLLDMLAAVARKDYVDRRHRQAQGQAKAKAEGRSL
jgi:CIC family chloride channel protein